MSRPSDSVAEMQGLYGPFTIPERVVQKIWLQQDFAVTGACLADGRSLGVEAPGRWNLLGGPDFKQARLRFGGQDIRGDVEVHFHAGDWSAHGHRDNPAYADVVLHVVLFPPEAGTRPQRRVDGTEIPMLVLLPLLHRDLEEYAADDALEALTARDEWRRWQELSGLPPDEIRPRLRSAAAQRWQRKLATARLRVARLGRDAAAHHTALEILGYRHNRAPMLALAERWPLTACREGHPPAPFAGLVPGWQLHGVRPANRPALRLEQYRAWVAKVPDWPAQLEALALRSSLAMRPDRETDSGCARRVNDFVAWRADFQELCGSAVGGSRLDTLVCDGLLPLAAVLSDPDGWEGLWFHWYPGDLPDQIRRALTRLGVSGMRSQPLCHGYAQGLLGWLLERGGHA